MFLPVALCRFAVRYMHHPNAESCFKPRLRFPLCFVCRHTYTVKFFLVDQNGVEYLAAVGAPFNLVHVQL